MTDKVDGLGCVEPRIRKNFILSNSGVLKSSFELAKLNSNLLYQLIPTSDIGIELLTIQLTAFLIARSDQIHIGIAMFIS